MGLPDAHVSVEDQVLLLRDERAGFQGLPVEGGREFHAGVEAAFKGLVCGEPGTAHLPVPVGQLVLGAS